MLPSIVTVHAFTPSVKMALLLFVCLFFQAHYCGIFIQVTYFHPSLQCVHSLPHSHFSLQNTVFFFVIVISIASSLPLPFLPSLYGFSWHLGSCYMYSIPSKRTVCRAVHSSVSPLFQLGRQSKCRSSWLPRCLPIIIVCVERQGAVHLHASLRAWSRVASHAGVRLRLRWRGGGQRVQHQYSTQRGSCTYWIRSVQFIPSIHWVSRVIWGRSQRRSSSTQRRNAFLLLLLLLLFFPFFCQSLFQDSTFSIATQ